MATTRKRSTPRAKKDAEARVQNEIRAIHGVHLCGILLETIAEYVATGRTNSPLRKVLEAAEHRASQAAWRRAMARMLPDL